MESIRWPFLETQEGSTQAGIDVYYESQFLTISEIVELLTPSSPLRHHPEAIYHFFYTYKMFTTPEFFLMLIKKRYANIPESLSQAKYFIRLGVYLVLSLWLNMEFENDLRFNLNLRETFLSFLSQDVRPIDAAIAARLQEAYNKKMSSSPPPSLKYLSAVCYLKSNLCINSQHSDFDVNLPLELKQYLCSTPLVIDALSRHLSQASSGNNNHNNNHSHLFKNISQIPFETFAEHWTLFERRSFSLLTPSHFLKQAQNIIQTSRRIQQAISFCINVDNCNSLDLMYWINVGVKLLEIHNFQGSFTIFQVLDKILPSLEIFNEFKDEWKSFNALMYKVRLMLVAGKLVGIPCLTERPTKIIISKLEEQEIHPDTTERIHWQNKKDLGILFEEFFDTFNQSRIEESPECTVSINLFAMSTFIQLCNWDENVIT